MIDIITIAAAFGGGFGTCLLGFCLRRRKNQDWRQQVPYSAAAIYFRDTIENAAKENAAKVTYRPRPWLWPQQPAVVNQYSNHPQGLPPPPLGPDMSRWFINKPETIRQCGGPCTNGAVFCDCGALWVNVTGVVP